MLVLIRQLIWVYKWWWFCLVYFWYLMDPISKSNLTAACMLVFIRHLVWYRRLIILAIVCVWTDSIGSTSILCTSRGSSLKSIWALYCLIVYMWSLGIPLRFQLLFALMIAALGYIAMLSRWFPLCFYYLLFFRILRWYLEFFEIVFVLVHGVWLSCLFEFVVAHLLWHNLPTTHHTWNLVVV